MGFKQVKICAVVSVVFSCVLGFVPQAGADIFTYNNKVIIEGTRDFIATSTNALAFVQMVSPQYHDKIAGCTTAVKKILQSTTEYSDFYGLIRIKGTLGIHISAASLVHEAAHINTYGWSACPVSANSAEAQTLEYQAKFCDLAKTKDPVRADMWASYAAFYRSQKTSWCGGTNGPPASPSACAAPSDSTAPGRIQSLNKTGQTSSNVALSWTATGDDGAVGTAHHYELRYNLSAITDSNWASSSLASGVPTPLPANQSQTATVNGLSAGRNYYFAIKAFDEAGNAGPLSNVVSALTGSPPPADVTAPAAVANLSVSAQTSTSVTLRWTATGDDNVTGTAASYDLRRSASPIAALTDFNAATQVSGEPSPGAAGAAQSTTVAGLAANTLYHFALRVRDEAGNLSLLSNAVSARTDAVLESLPRNGGASYSSGSDAGVHLNARDAKLYTKWMAKGSPAEAWVSVDLGAAQTIKQVRFHYGYWKKSPLTIEAQRSDDNVTWQSLPLSAPAPSVPLANWNTLTINDGGMPIQARYVRLFFRNHPTDKHADLGNIAELEVWGIRAAGSSGLAQSAPELTGALSPVKFISPLVADGTNDAAMFGPEAEEVQILDVAGRLVYEASLSNTNGMLLAWDARTSGGEVVSSGAYIAKIKTRDGATLNQTLVVVK